MGRQGCRVLAELVVMKQLSHLSAAGQDLLHKALIKRSFLEEKQNYVRNRMILILISIILPIL